MWPQDLYWHGCRRYLDQGDLLDAGVLFITFRSDIIYQHGPDIIVDILLSGASQGRFHSWKSPNKSSSDGLLE